MGQRLALKERSNEIGNDNPRGISGLCIVAWSLAGGDLAPSANAVSYDLHQQNSAILHRSKTGLERRLEPQMDLPKYDGLDLHGKLPDRLAS